MPTAYTETQYVSGNYEYYLKLIINEINECLNLSGISYSEENQVPQKNSESVKIIFILIFTLFFAIIYYCDNIKVYKNKGECIF